MLGSKSFWKDPRALGGGLDRDGGIFKNIHLTTKIIHNVFWIYIDYWQVEDPLCWEERAKKGPDQKLLKKHIWPWARLNSMQHGWNNISPPFFAMTRFFGPGLTSVPSTLEPLGSQLRERRSQATTSPAIMTLYGQNVQKYVDDIRTGLTVDFLSIGLKSSKKTATHFKYGWMEHVKT